MLTNRQASKLIKALPWPINLCLALIGTEKDIENPAEFIANLTPDYEACIERMLETLPNPEYREIFLARYRDKKTLPQIANEFGKTSERIRQIVTRERFRLRYPSCIRYLKYGIEKVEAEDAAARAEALREKAFEETEIWEFKDKVLTVRACNGLCRHGYRTVADVLRLDENSIQLLPNVGKQTAENIRQAQAHFKSLLSQKEEQ